MTDPIRDEHYPGLFRSADTASLAAQRVYLILQRLYLGSLLVGSGVSAFSGLVDRAGSAWLHSALAIILAVGLLVLWVTRARQDERAWFDCRAVAESTKTATWRFMMGAPPYQVDDSLEQRFVSELGEIRKARPGFEKHLAGRIDANAAAITEFMRTVRSKPFEARKAFYLDQRLQDQKGWYSRKANTNARLGHQWFWATVALQALAVAMAIVRAASGGLALNVVPFLTTCAAAVAAWSQMKRYDELKQSYSLAAQELGELEAIATGLKDEAQFPQLVEQVEEAISREHTMWCARRDVRLPARGGGHGRQEQAR